MPAGRRGPTFPGSPVKVFRCAGGQPHSNRRGRVLCLQDGPNACLLECDDPVEAQDWAEFLCSSVLSNPPVIRNRHHVEAVGAAVSEAVALYGGHVRPPGIAAPSVVSRSPRKVRGRVLCKMAAATAVAMITALSEGRSGGPIVRDHAYARGQHRGPAHHPQPRHGRILVAAQPSERTRGWGRARRKAQRKYRKRSTSWRRGSPTAACSQSGWRRRRRSWCGMQVALQDGQGTGEGRLGWAQGSSEQARGEG